MAGDGAGSAATGGSPEWSALLAAASEAAARGYAPYSGYQVGAAALTEDGRTVTGCNVENASYGLGLCAECGLISHLHLGGGGRLSRFVCVSAAGAVILPCGRCRQLLHENAGDELVLLTPAGERRLGDLLPDAFGADDLR